MRQADGYLRLADARRQAAVVRAKYPENPDASHLVMGRAGPLPWQR